jgi:hypothetical protein
MRIFILEDDARRIELFNRAFIGHQLTIAEDIDAAEKAFAPPYDLMCLDHDLGGQVFVPAGLRNTGSAFVSGLSEEDVAASLVLVHSHNPDGALAMKRTLIGKKALCLTYPFNQELLVQILALAEAVHRGPATLQNA